MPSRYKAYFQKAMQERAADLAAVGFASDGKALLARLGKEEPQGGHTPASAPPRASEKKNAFETAWLKRSVPEFLEFLKRQKSKIPDLEYAGLERAGQRAQTLEDLRATRAQLASRLLTILRLRKHQSALRALLPAEPANTEVPLGPYNSHRTLLETLAFANEDPLWLHDFLELYAEALDLNTASPSK